MSFKEIIAVYSKNYMKPINTICGQNAELLEGLCSMQSVRQSIPGTVSETVCRCIDSALCTWYLL
jgi:hypothetical protein